MVASRQDQSIQSILYDLVALRRSPLEILDAIAQAFRVITEVGDC